MRPLAADFATKVVGVSHIDRYPSNVFALEHRLRFPEVRFARPARPVPVRLRREPANPHDANAVAVEDDHIGVFGHLPATLAARLAVELDAGTPWVAEVVNVAIHPQRQCHPGVELRLRRAA